MSDESFGSVQVRLPGDPSGWGPARDRVVDAVAAALEEAGWERCASGEEAGRELAVGPLGDAPWISVWDDRLAEASPDLLDALARAATGPGGATGGRAVGVAVQDGALLALRLHASGELEDAHEVELGTSPAGFPDPTTATASPELWTDLLAPGHDVADLRAAWSEDVPVDPEEALERVAEVFGWKPERLRPDAASTCPGTTVLRFRRPERGAVAGSTAAARAPADVDAPRLASVGTAGDWEGAIGDTIEVVLRLRNDGDAGRGLALQCWGHALQIGAVEPVAARVGDATADFVETAEATRRAELPDVLVPTGAAATTEKTAGVGEDAPADVEVTLSLLAREAAWTQLFVACIPLENRRRGQAASAVMLSVSAKPRA